MRCTRGWAPRFGLAVGLAVGLEGVPSQLAVVATPLAILRLDHRAALATVLVVGLGVGIAFGLGFPLGSGFAVGLASGLAFGLVISMLKTAWPSYLLIRVWLASHHRLPWALMGFLADAHRRGVLRQVGAFYQFRHIELQHQLASRHSHV